MQLNVPVGSNIGLGDVVKVKYVISSHSGELSLKPLKTDAYDHSVWNDVPVSKPVKPGYNIFGASMQEVQAAESYFNCIYDDGVMLITNRYEDGYGALEHMTANNSASR